MARLQTVDELLTSGYRLSVLREGDDFKTFTEDMLTLMRLGALERMGKALDHIVGAIRKKLSRQYPLIRTGRLRHHADRTVRLLRGLIGGPREEVRRPSPPGAPPGRISGDLALSWQRRKPTWSKQRTVLTGRYFARHPAAGVLERGSPSQGIAARPYQRPTLAREANRLSAILDGLR